RTPQAEHRSSIGASPKKNGIACEVAMRKLQPEDLTVEWSRVPDVSNREMAFVRMHVTRLHALYQRTCLGCFYRGELDVVLFGIAAVVEIIYCANVLREEKVQCPVRRDTNLFVQAR